MRDGKALIAAAVALNPHIITDIDMPLTGLEAVHQLKALVPYIKVIVQTDHKEPEWAAAVVAASASVFLMKNWVPIRPRILCVKAGNIT